MNIQRRDMIVRTGLNGIDLPTTDVRQLVEANYRDAVCGLCSCRTPFPRRRSTLPHRYVSFRQPRFVVRSSKYGTNNQLSMKYKGPTAYDYLLLEALCAPGVESEFSSFRKLHRVRAKIKTIPCLYLPGLIMRASSQADNDPANQVPTRNTGKRQSALSILKPLP